MAGKRRCELLAPIANGWGDTFPVAFARTIEHTTLVNQVTSRPNLELTRLWQADEGCIFLMAGGQRRESFSTASRYHLRSTQTRTYRRERAAEPGVRLATSPAKGTATEMRSGRRSSHIKAKSLTSTPQEKDDAVLTMQVVLRRDALYALHHSLWQTQ